MSDLNTLTPALQERSAGCCELCRATDDLAVFEVPPMKSGDATAALFACGLCRTQLEGGDLDEKHFYCLKESMWSEVPAVQVASYRLLKRMQASGWAGELLEQMYLPEDLQAWADAAGTAAPDDEVKTLDSNGTRLADGDSVTLIKDLDVKGAGFVAKRGTLVKNIRLIGDPENIEGRINKTLLVLKTKFMKKA